jgi:hypothetical protein
VCALAEPAGVDRTAGGEGGRGRRRQGCRLKKRTLTNLYNERPQWLKLAHEKLDRAVLAAYAATDRDGNWSEDWVNVWVDTGAGQPLRENHPLTAERKRVDQLVLANLLQNNQVRKAFTTRVQRGRELMALST